MRIRMPYALAPTMSKPLRRLSRTSLRGRKRACPRRLASQTIEGRQSRPQHDLTRNGLMMLATTGFGSDGIGQANRTTVGLAARAHEPYLTTMSELDANFVDPERVKLYTEKGPPAFAPGHAGMLQMIGVLLAETMPEEGQILVVGAGGGLETRYLAGIEPNWRFLGVDPAVPMIELARAVAGPMAGDRLTLIEGTVDDAPAGPFDAATCILVLGLIADDGAKQALLEQVRRRLAPDAPFILVDQCIDRSAPDFQRRLDRYADYARMSDVDAETITKAKAGVGSLESMVPHWRNEQLLREAGFHDAEVFYVGMAWRGWIAYA